MKSKCRKRFGENLWGLDVDGWGLHSANLLVEIGVSAPPP